MYLIVTALSTPSAALNSLDNDPMELEEEMHSNKRMRMKWSG